MKKKKLRSARLSLGELNRVLSLKGIVPGLTRKGKLCLLVKLRK